MGGCQGSYEIMKHNLKKDVDYILVPPAVWDVLYELYGGGPPLPRMVARKDSWAVVTTSMAETTKTGGGVMLDDGVGVETVVRCDGGYDGGVGGIEFDRMPNQLPRYLTVETHPWVLSCHVSLLVLLLHFL